MVGFNFAISQSFLRALGGVCGVTTGAGSAGQSGTNVGGVERHLFCNTGVITPFVNDFLKHLHGYQ